MPYVYGRVICGCWFVVVGCWLWVVGFWLGLLYLLRISPLEEVT